MPLFFATCGDDAPSFVPISLRLTADNFLSGPTGITLTVIPSSGGISQTTQIPSMAFTFGFYTLGATEVSASGIIAHLDPLPQPISHYFANVPESLPIFGDNAMCTISCLGTITELTGKTLVILSASNSEAYPTNTAVATIPVIAAVP